jgi:hypothetical protein
MANRGEEGEEPLEGETTLAHTVLQPTTTGLAMAGELQQQ